MSMIIVEHSGTESVVTCTSCAAVCRLPREQRYPIDSLEHDETCPLDPENIWYREQRVRAEAACDATYWSNR